MPIEVLILLSQALHDPSSGAARSLHLTGLLLAQARDAQGNAQFRIRFVGTTGTDDGGLTPNGETFLRLAGLTPVVVQRPFGRVLEYRDGDIECTLLDTSGQTKTLSQEQNVALDCLVNELTADRVPDIVYTYGGRREENARRMRLHDRGAVVLFGLNNWAYLHAAKDFFSPPWGTDGVIVASEYLRRCYQSSGFVLPACTAAFPTPMTMETVMATKRTTPGAVTFVNPTLDKGVMVFVRIADELARRRPDIPLLVVESRGRASALWEAARFAAVDLTRHPNLRVIPSLPLPRDVFALTRILLMPSVWDEPSGRLIAEAMFNGVPPIVSDRGGMPDECRGAGFVIALPRHIQPENTLPLTAIEAEPWIETIVRLWDSPEAYEAASIAARQATQACRPEIVQVQCEEFFHRAAGLRRKIT